MRPPPVKLSICSAPRIRDGDPFHFAILDDQIAGTDTESFARAIKSEAATFRVRS